MSDVATWLADFAKQHPFVALFYVCYNALRWAKGNLDAFELGIARLATSPRRIQAHHKRLRQEALTAAVHN